MPLADMSLPRLTVQNEHAIGFGTQTFLDGEPVHGLTDIELHIGLDEVNRATLSFVVGAAEVDVGAAIRWRVRLATEGARGIGEGDTVAEALRALAFAIEADLTPSSGGV